MILSGRDLKWYIETERLGVDPPLAANQFQQNGLDLILASVDRDLAVVSCETPTFCLGSSVEVLSMPDDLMAFVELRSTWARMGALIPPTVVDAGFRGNLTLELIFHRPIQIPVGERFIHLIFAKLSSPSEPYDGKYQDQRGITHARGMLGESRFKR